MASKLKVVLFLGSVRENRLGERVAKFMKTQLEAAEFDVNVFGKTKCDISVIHHYKVVIIPSVTSRHVLILPEMC